MTKRWKVGCWNCDEGFVDALQRKGLIDADQIITDAGREALA